MTKKPIKNPTENPIDNPIENPTENPIEPIEPIEVPDSTASRYGLKLACLTILISAVSLIGYVLWPNGDRSPADSARFESGVDPITTARIYPRPAYATNTLELRLADRYWMLQDSLDYRWFCNDQIITAATGASLGTNNYKKGDEIFVEVTLQRKNQPTRRFRTAVTKVRNTPPRIMSASTLIQKLPDQKVEAVVQSRDVDGDRVSYRYAWFKNGKRIQDQAKSTLDPIHFTRGDKIYAEIVADDGEELSPKKKSAPLTFENSPPRISSVPPSRMAEKRRFVYQLQVTDVDGDVFTYQLAQSPPGMTISPTGRIEWELPPEELGTRSFAVKVVIKDDAGGETIQSFEITMSGAQPDEEAKQD